MQGAQNIEKKITVALKIIDVVDKKQMYDSVITGKENASKEWNCIISYYIDESWQVAMSVLCLIRHILCVNALKLLSSFFGTKSDFFGEDRLATLVRGQFWYWSGSLIIMNWRRFKAFVF